MKNLLTALTIFLGLVLDTTLFSRWTFKGIRPDLLLVIIVGLALIRGKRAGLVWGGIAGALQDLLVGGSTLAGYILIKPLLGFLNGFLTKKIYRENILLPVILVLMMTFLQELLVLFLHIGLVKAWLHAMLVIILPEAVFNAILTLIVYPLLLKWEERAETMSAF